MSLQTCSAATAVNGEAGASHVCAVNPSLGSSGHVPREIRTVVMAEGVEGLAKLVWTLRNVVLDQQTSKTFLWKGNTREAEELLSIPVENCILLK